MEYYENSAIVNVDNKVRNDIVKKDILEHLAIAKEKEAEIYALNLIIKKLKAKTHSLYMIVAGQKAEAAIKRQGRNGPTIAMLIWLGIASIPLSIASSFGSLLENIGPTIGSLIMMTPPIIILFVLARSNHKDDQAVQELEKNIKDQVKIYETKIQEVEKYIAEKQKNVDAFYAKTNFIYAKYRNFVAVSTIWEYLISERCDTLTGAQGAYNLFESEVRLDKIVGNLENISDSVQRIKDVQYALYEAITGAEFYVDSMNLNIDSLSTDDNSIIEKIRGSSFSL